MDNDLTFNQHSTTISHWLEELKKDCILAKISIKSITVDLMEELELFCQERNHIASIPYFKSDMLTNLSKTAKEKYFEVYIPQKNWAFNPGKELEEAAAQYINNNFWFSKTSDILLHSDIQFAEDFDKLIKEFEEFLSDKYHYPGYELHKDKSSMQLLSWHPDMARIQVPNYYNMTTILPFKSFMIALLKDNSAIEKVRQRRIEQFLADNPEIRSLRAKFLNHSVTAKMVASNKVVPPYEISKLLKQVDDILCVLYRDFQSIYI